MHHNEKWSNGFVAIKKVAIAALSLTMMKVIKPVPWFTVNNSPTGNLHKWCYTNRGCAVLYVKPEHRQYIEPTVISKNYQHKNFGVRFNFQGTDDFTIYCVVKEAFKFYKEIGGLVSVLISLKT